jgi:mevalonate kinase
MPAISCVAPGKMILCGEHAVVYNQPAIAIPVMSLFTNTKIFARPTDPQGEVFIRAKSIQLEESLARLPADDSIRRTIELVMEYFSLSHIPACEVLITSTLPVASGMGSSASLSVSLIRALSEFIGHPLQTEQINRLAFEAEKFHHVNPSGVDNTVITYQRPLYYIRGNTPEFLHVKKTCYFLAANTGIAASTAQAVAGVRERWQKETDKYEKYFSLIGQITEQVRERLSNGDIEIIGELLTQNHTYLQQIGVSCPELDHLVDAALTAGALGAKLSGGGLGGNMLALCASEDRSKVKEALLQAGAISTVEMTLAASLEE